MNFMETEKFCVDLKVRLCSSWILQFDLQKLKLVQPINSLGLSTFCEVCCFVKMFAKMISQRSSHQRSIVRLETSSDALDEESPLSAVESFLDLLEDYWSKFQTVQLSIEEKADDENIENEVTVLQITEISYLKAKSKLKTLVDVAVQNNKEKTNANGENDQRNNNAKLPKLEVPKFDGSFNNWSSFRDMFTSMVRNQACLTDGQKLQYLKPNVFNEAADIVSEYKITDANFDAAWAALEARYDNERLQIKAHLDTLFDQEIMLWESAEALRLLLRTTQKCLRSLKSFGGLVESWDWLLVHLICTRLDPKTRRYWELTHTSKEMATFQQLVTALENRCNALESDKSSS